MQEKIIATLNQPDAHSDSSIGRMAHTLTGVFHWFYSNPIILREFLRLSRSFRYWGLMGLLLIFVSLILCLAWSSNQFEDPITPIGRRLFYILLAAELGVIFLLLPGVVSHSIITEREQDTYPLLLTTPLSPGRIIGGKLVSTLGAMILLIASTFPLFGICVARGGVSPGEMIGGAFYLLFACLIAASASIYHALNAATTLRAVLTTHITLFVAIIAGGATLAFSLGIFFSILAVAAEIAAQKWPYLSITNWFGYIWFWTLAGSGTGLAAWFTYWLLKSSLSRLRYDEPPVRNRREMERIRRFYLKQQIDQDGEPAAPSYWEFSDNANPFYIRERLSYALMSPLSSISSWYIIILLCHILFLLTPISEGRWAAVFTLLAIGQMAPAYAGALFAREKEQNTLDLLLTTVCQTRVLLHGKILGALSQCLPRAGILFSLPFAVAFMLFWMLNWITPHIGHFFQIHHLFCYAAVLTVQMLFILTTTSYFSLFFSRIGSAMTAGYVLSIAVFALPFLIGFIIDRLQAPFNSAIVYSLSPIYVIYTTPASQGFTSSSVPFMLHLGGHIIFYVILAILFYFLSIRVLRQMR